ncbi:putative bifunctional diguanylate cyclase/phosphodiesterase [Longimicrobium sp.]|uniref:putative bifunctional diguanylate cyclase/phosphodiesterase n=1 Tax=Longimicrobium sp. TaxID=2029185 RepID=UPI003B3BBF9D
MTDFRDAGPWFTEGPAMLAAVSPAGTVLASSRAAAQAVGRTPEELEGVAFSTLYHPEDRSAACAAHADALSAPGTDVSRALRKLRADGCVLRVDETLRAIEGTGGTVVLIHTQDASGRNADVGSREGEERYALALEGASEGLWDWDIGARRLSPSPRLMALLGYAEGEVGNDPAEWLDRIHPEDVEHMRTVLALLRNGERPYVESVHRMRHRDGGWRWTHVRAVAVMGPEGAAVRVAGSLSDVTDRKVAEELLLHNALHDALTGLPNRTLLLDRVGLALRRGSRLGRSCAVLCVGLDGFKVVNDSLGHAVGDLLLDRVARRLEGALRVADTVARLGADVFGVLVDELNDPAEARTVAERVHEAMREPFYLQGRAVFASASIGIGGGGDGAAAEVLVRDAETAMYRAKKRGRAGTEMFDATMQATALQRLHLETDLRGAVDREEFELAYQPVVSLADGRIAGFEALARWRHPERGLLQPSEFISAAEETGLIVPLGRWVLREACRQMRDWNRRYGAALSVNVNLSPRQFADPALASDVAEALRETELPAAFLKLEITENLLMGDAGGAAATLEELKTLGVDLCIDDFGTGYSSLSYLHRFPIDTLKVDRSFIMRLGDGQTEQIVRTILVLARTLGMRAVAEGVETPEQADSLRGMGCEYAQGFRFSHPVAGDAAGAMIWRQRLSA